MFAIECWQANPSDTPRRIETIRAKLSHIRWCHQLVAGYRPSLAPHHELVIQGMRRLSPPRQQRGAVSTAMLTVIIKAANMSISQHRVFESQAAIKLTDLHNEPTPSLIHRVHDKNPETSSRAMQYTSAHDINPLTQNGRCNCASFSRRRYGHDSHARTLGIRRIPSVHTRNTSSNITPRQTHESCHITCKSTSPNRSTKWGNTSVNSRVIESITSKCKKNDLFFPNTDDDEVKGNGHLLAAAKEGFSGTQESQYQTEQSARHTSFYPAQASMPSRTPSRSSLR
ncbi:hypothetical protein GN958_ATG13895 [Phytophthora infestans]|uniref:Uncharacterized protein n=1 Tax=Phytophthora infestans TaxID=4787 RepID=A0A8S9U754_PHYIN|nr:hypothetical protein GN958_ATG13895 [Phytophthora infestans]